MNRLKTVIPVLTGAAILCALAFLNGYPFVYSDTGTYLSSGWELKVPVDRPIAYGLFTRLFNGISLWPVVLVQNLLTAFVLFRVFRFFFRQDPNIHRYFYLTIAILTTVSGIAWYSNQLMPDFLTPLLILSLFLLYYDKNPGKVNIIFLSVFTAFCLLCHFSHLLIASALAAGVLIHNLYYQRRFSQAKIPRKRGIAVSILALSGWWLLPSLNLAITGEFYSSKSSHAFFMASMAEKGILKGFLKDNCHKPEFSGCVLCQYQDNIPGEVGAFLWAGGDSSAFNRSGGFVNSKAEYTKIIRASLLDPKYASQHVYKSVVYGLSQLMDNDIGSGLGSYRENSAPYFIIEKKYRPELNMYLNSKQNRENGLKFYVSAINEINLKVLMLCVLFLLYIYSSGDRKKYRENTVFFLSWAILGVVINSLVTAGLSAPYARYQARVVWLIELAIILFTILNWNLIRERILKLFRPNK